MKFSNKIRVLKQYDSTTKWVGSVYSEKLGSVCSGILGSVSRGKRGSVWAKFPVEDGDAGQDHVWRFNPATNSWVKLGPVPPGWNREFCVSFTIGNYGYAGTGEAGSFTQYNDLWEYTPCVDIITEVKPIEQTKTRMQVYPNPFKTQATFSLNTEVKNAVLSIYELNGREAKSVNFTGKQVILEREGLQSGVYIYSLSTNEQVIATGKLVIE